MRDATLAALPPLSATPTSIREARPRTRRPLHVAFALGGTDLGRSGIGTYVREVLPPLVAQLKAEGGALVAFGRENELAAYADVLSGALQHRANAPEKPGANALWHLFRAGETARRLGADVLLLPAANRRIIARSPVPSVAVVHDLAQLRVQQKYDRLRMFYFRQVLLRSFRKPTRLVAISRATRGDLCDVLQWAEEKIPVVYNGVNTEVFRQLDRASSGVSEVLRTHGLHTRPFLFYPARLEHPGKNHVRLLHAFAQSGLATTHTLALSGADWGAGETIQSLIQELKLTDCVRHLGFVPKEHLPTLVAGCDALVMLGLHEGFGLPALEGLSAGRPVCVSNTAALPEVVGELGVQCDPLDVASITQALLRVTSDRSMRARCEREGPAWAERFTWTKTARGLIDLCHEAVATRTKT